MKKITVLLMILLLLTMAGAALATEDNGPPEKLYAWLTPQPLTPDGDISDAQWAVPAEITGESLSGRVWGSWQPGKPMSGSPK